MKLSDVLKSVGQAVFAELVPGGQTIIDTVNKLVGNDVLSPRSTGGEVSAAINQLPEAEQLQLLSREIDFEIAKVNSWTEIQLALNSADSVGNSTRPKIALLMAYVVLFSVVLLTLCIAYAFVMNVSTLIKAMGDAWPLVLAILATPTALLRSYFGLRTTEKRARYSAAAGSSPPGIFSSIASFFKR